MGWTWINQVSLMTQGSASTSGVLRWGIKTPGSTVSGPPNLGPGPHTFQGKSVSLTRPAPLLQDSLGHRAACEAATWQALWAGREVVIDRWVLRRQATTASQITRNSQQKSPERPSVASEACWMPWGLQVQLR